MLHRDASRHVARIINGNRNWHDVFVPIPTSILQLSDPKDEPLRAIGLVAVSRARGEWI